jgi:hypothetical protein
MSEVETPQEQPTEEPATEEPTTEEPSEESEAEDHSHDVFSVPSELAPDVVEALEDAGFELSQEPEPQPYPEPPNIYESAPEDSTESEGEAEPEETA